MSGQAFSQVSYLQRVTAICFSVYHIEHLLLHCITGGIPSRPIVRCTASLRSNEEILWIVDVLVWTILNAMNYLEVGTGCQHGACIDLFVFKRRSDVLVARDLTILLEVYIVYRHSKDICQVPRTHGTVIEPHLIKENILPVTALSRKVLKVPILADPVLQAQLLPELTADCKSVSVSS